MVREPNVPKAAAELSEMTPCWSLILPEIVFVPERARIPVPALVKPAVPATFALMVVTAEPVLVIVGVEPASVSVWAPAIVMPCVLS